MSAYRGQNANMHMTEAMLAAYETTGDVKYLDRAEVLARRICIELPAQVQGVVWEHYREDWSVDWDYNKGDPKHLFRPCGYLPGHMTEWTKLLLILERYRPQDWILPQAILLYETALAKSADLEFGGLHYSYGPALALGTACLAAGAAQARERLEFVHLTQTGIDNSFRQSIRKGMDDVHTQFQTDCQLLFTIPNGNLHKHLQNLETVVGQGVDGVVNDDLYDEAIEKALDKKIADVRSDRISVYEMTRMIS